MIIKVVGRLKEELDSPYTEETYEDVIIQGVPI